MTWTLPACGAALVLLTLAGTFAHESGRGDLGAEPYHAMFVLLGIVAVGAYFVAAGEVTRRVQPRRALWLVLAVGVVLRAIVIPPIPFLSTDLFRYVWDGRVQLAGGNPYAQVPAAPELQALRDDAVYPHINRADYAPTIYPPVAQVVFRAVAWLARATGMRATIVERLTMAACEGVTIAAVIRLLDLARLDRARVLIYAWNPLVVWEFTGNGHIDAASTAFVALALLAAVGGQRTLTGLALGAAALIKLLPLALAPALWRRWDWRMPLAMAVLGVASYALFIDAGWKVLGFLGGYSAEEGLADGTGFWWLDAASHVAPLPAGVGRVWMALAVLGLAALALWIVSRNPVTVRQRCHGIVILGTAMLAVITPHYPWYFAWMAMPSCVVPFASVLWLSVAAIVQYHNPLHDTGIWFALIYVPFVVLAIRDIAQSGGYAPRAVIRS